MHPSHLDKPSGKSMSSNSTTEESLSIEAQLAEKEQQVLELKKRVEENKQELYKLTDLLTKEKSHSLAISRTLNEREQVLQDLNSKLWEIYNSRAWRLIQILWKIRLSLLPPNGRLSNVIRRIYHWKSLFGKRKLHGNVDTSHSETLPVIDTSSETYFEQQGNYSNAIVYKSVKVLSFFLPEGIDQIRIQGSRPLPLGFYPSREPHHDIDYTSLTISEVLKRQVGLMKRAGVYGQIFHHDWSTGKLSFESPAQILLFDKSIEMPFCFCWVKKAGLKTQPAGFNAWQVEEQASEQDAIEFINYLIPFFKDERYIRVDEKPVLFLQLSTRPELDLYKIIWEKICMENGLKPPYIVLLLNEDRETLKDLEINTGCEDPIYDLRSGVWNHFNGNPQQALVPILPLDYSRVAEYFMRKEPGWKFTCFRSIIPFWADADQSGHGATIIQGATPEKFQEWLEFLVVNAQEKLPGDQRYIVVNAWNDWLHGAVLEPDNQFGYAYLNAIGRSLSGIGFEEREYLHREIPFTLHVSIVLDNDLIALLRTDDRTRNKLLTCIGNSSLLSLCGVSFKQRQVEEWMGAPSLNSRNIPETGYVDYVIHIKKVCYFSSDTFENMLKLALGYDVGIVNPVQVNDPNFDHTSIKKRWETSQVSEYLTLTKTNGRHSIKCCVDAEIFISTVSPLQSDDLPKVSTIVRFGNFGDIKILRRALYSLLAQTACLVQPILTLQDFSDDGLEELKRLLDEMPWDSGCYPIIQDYRTTSNLHDLRSLMLNEAFKSVATKYVSFLDHDDTIFHDAYAWLIARLEKNNKNASFGLIYTVAYNVMQNKIRQRTVFYDYGRDYKYFLQVNHSPLHGIMFNLERIDRDRIEYHADMKFMEDYYLTLQIFTENDTDWDALKERKFVGDYYHYDDKPQTLGLLDENERNRLMASPDYKKCQIYITEMKTHLRKKYNL